MYQADEGNKEIEKKEIDETGDTADQRPTLIL